MTDQWDAALRSLLDDVCRHPNTGDFAATWGTVEDSRYSPGGWTVVCPPDSPIASLDIQRWDVDGIGIVEVTWKAERQPSWSALRERFGPFEELDEVPGRSPRYAVDWPMPFDQPADAVLLVTVDDDGAIEGVTVRRDPRR